MERRPNFLEANNSILEKRLLIVNDYANEAMRYYQQAKEEQKAPPRDYKIITPTPGFCIKSFKTNTNEKFFINVCQAADIPPPKDISEDELSEILKSSEPSNFRIPMSISEPRISKDKSDRPVDVCDVAINPKFFVKCQKSTLFKEFFMALIAEALSAKYNVQLSQEKTIILNNRKCIGTLVKHRVRNNDIESVLTANKNQAEPKRKLIEEIEEPALVEQFCTKVAIIPEHITYGKLNEKNCVEELLTQFYLPKCVSANDISVYAGKDRIVLESDKQGYFFEKFVKLPLNPNCGKAVFNHKDKMLDLHIPVLAEK